MFHLRCAVQNYQWGKPADDSLVSEVFAGNGGQVDKEKPYAEYWMGSHPNAPAKVDLEGQATDLSEFLFKNYNHSGGLPFLFKVLSIKSPLSIQLHPDKGFAEKLHQKDSEHYKDENHKPEMATAVSEEFELFYGMLGINHALDVVKHFYESFKFVEKEAEQFLQESDEKTYGDFMAALCSLGQDECALAVEKLLESKASDDFTATKLTIAKTLKEIFGVDRGILFSLFMNYYKLNKGESLFIKPNVPHAYIRGDCLECMANSDNVIRVGLTPKFVDTTHFIQIMATSFSSMISTKLETIGEKLNERLVVYRNLDFPEFKLFEVTLNEKVGNTQTLEIKNFAILFVLKGSVEIHPKLIEEFRYLSQPYGTYLLEKETNVGIYNRAAEKEVKVYIATY